mgnify:CR=1 FL=1
MGGVIRSAKYSALLFIILLTLACGSSGGDDPPPVIALKTSTVRQTVSGDSWNYTVTARLYDASTTYNLTGSATEQILSSTVFDPVTSTNCLDQFGTLTLSGSGQTLNDSYHDYGLQDSNGTIQIYGEDEDSGNIWINTAPGYYVQIVSPVTLGQSGGKTFTYTDGSSQTYAYVIEGSTVNASTPLGIFESYRINVDRTRNYADGRRLISHSQADFVPGLMAAVKETSTASVYQGTTYLYSLDVTRTLSSTNISY